MKGLVFIAIFIVVVVAYFTQSMDITNPKHQAKLAETCRSSLQSHVERGYKVTLHNNTFDFTTSGDSITLMAEFDMTYKDNKMKDHVTCRFHEKGKMTSIQTLTYSLK